MTASTATILNSNSRNIKLKGPVNSRAFFLKRELWNAERRTQNTGRRRESMVPVKAAFFEHKVHEVTRGQELTLWEGAFPVNAVKETHTETPAVAH
jgi:hypothetical protein